MTTDFPWRPATRDNARAAMRFLGIDDSAFSRNKYGNLYRWPIDKSERARLFVFLRVMWSWSYPEITAFCGMTTHSTVYDAVRRLLATDGDVDYHAAMVERWKASGFVFSATPPEPPKQATPEPVKVQALPPMVPQKPKSVAYITQMTNHGPRCECATCRHFADLAAKIVARNPDVKPSSIDVTVRNFVRYEIAKRQQEAA
jgi:hypothetical protein